MMLMQSQFSHSTLAMKVKEFGGGRSGARTQNSTTVDLQAQTCTPIACPYTITMAPLNRSVASGLLAPASRLLSRVTLSHQGPRSIRWETAGHNPPKEAGGQAGRPEPSSQEPPSGPSGASAMIRQEGPAEGTPRHAPDYGSAVDYRTS